MSQHAASFFGQERLLWPLHREALSSLQQGFFSRRAQLATSLLRELHDGSPLLRLNQLPLIPSTLPGLTSRNKQQNPTPGTSQEVQQVTEGNGELLVTLDARGFAPGDITVKLEGRRLAVVAMKQTAAEERQSCSSACSCVSSRSADMSRAGFAQMINLPDHLDLTGLSCALMDDGQLRIHAPVASVAEEREVPIRYRSSLEFPITNKTEEEEHTD